MKIRAYPETYLHRVQATLGAAFEFAINCCGIPGQEFLSMFSVSSASRRIEQGDPAYLAGKSGIELALEIISEATEKEIDSPSATDIQISPQYWLGWAIAYVQWQLDMPFRDLISLLNYDELMRLYHPYHEADISKLISLFQSIKDKALLPTRLRKMRGYRGASQSQLARDSGVSLRSIQMYEQRNKDINKASADTIYRLAKTLGCQMEDLLER